MNAHGFLVCMRITCMPGACTARRGHQIAWHWSHRRLVWLPCGRWELHQLSTRAALILTTELSLQPRAGLTPNWLLNLLNTTTSFSHDAYKNDTFASFQHFKMLVIYCYWVFVCERCRWAEPLHHENQGLSSVVRFAPRECLPAEPF